MKTGLVLEGGAMRGIYTAGVLDVFLEQGIHFDGVNGVSAGALHGCSFVSGQKGRSLRYFKKYRNDKHFMSWWSFLHTGEVVGQSFCPLRSEKERHPPRQSAHSPPQCHALRPTGAECSHKFSIGRAVITDRGTV